MKQDTNPIMSMHQLQQTYMWFQAKKGFESLRRRRNYYEDTVIEVRQIHPNKYMSRRIATSDSNHGTTTVLRYSSSRHSILLSWINSLFRNHGGIRSSRYHAKRARCVTNNCPTANVTHLPSQQMYVVLLFPSYPSL